MTYTVLPSFGHPKDYQKLTILDSHPGVIAYVSDTDSAPGFPYPNHILFGLKCDRNKKILDEFIDLRRYAGHYLSPFWGWTQNGVHGWENLCTHYRYYWVGFPDKEILWTYLKGQLNFI
jgi:hypothetical protein